MHSKDKKHSDKSIQPCQFEENCVKNNENLRRNCSKIHPLKVFFRMSSHGLLSGNPSVLETMLSEMCIKREINDVETGSKAYFESMIYLNNHSRELILQLMETTDDNLIGLSKEFLANMKDVIRQQNEFMGMFVIQVDPDEQNELKILSKGWYNMLRRQLMRHCNILATALDQAAAMHDGDRVLKISKGIRSNGQIEYRLRRDSNERYPQASD